jgi:hypothetical protein
MKVYIIAKVLTTEAGDEVFAIHDTAYVDEEEANRIKEQMYRVRVVELELMTGKHEEQVCQNVKS